MADRPDPDRSLHRSSTKLMSTIIIALGIGILVSTIARSGVGLTYGCIVGVLFVAAGSGRLWVARKGL